eukprot:CAMPEP_0194126824 /NCGR_PEP_ID=MMETSP0150-20130528/60196_1 /TAXON_ID=122233 /ORGANISM="Chaetoceros debilis, Strain MM31A-1" /LENGTH=128 /DNA_ID=CAMNT_0038820709 /DNA_START=383 /DNA_END=769 /DNA_ORIENTATION=+
MNDDKKIGDPQASKLRIKNLKEELEKFKRQAQKKADIVKDLEEQLQRKGEECEHWRCALEEYKVSMEVKLHQHAKVSMNHEEKVESLKKLAEEDRTWLEKETARRKDRSEKIKNQTQEILERRSTIDW